MKKIQQLPDFVIIVSLTNARYIMDLITMETFWNQRVLKPWDISKELRLEKNALIVVKYDNHQYLGSFYGILDLIFCVKFAVID